MFQLPIKGGYLWQSCTQLMHRLFNNLAVFAAAIFTLFLSLRRISVAEKYVANTSWARGRPREA